MLCTPLYDDTPPSSHVKREWDPLVVSSNRLYTALLIPVSAALDFGAKDVVGVDIDPQLSNKAEHLLALRRSRLRPSEASAPNVDYFPMSAVLQYGRVPPSAPSPSSWPRVSFVAADWLSSSDPALVGPYDVILALNVIKWIHLEHLDAGLLAFFHKCQESLASGGYLVIQLQPWESYQKAVRTNAAPHFAANLATLRFRPETSFARLLQDEGLHLHASSNQLRRRIDIYRKA